MSFVEQVPNIHAWYSISRPGTKSKTVCERIRDALTFHHLWTTHPCAFRLLDEWWISRLTSRQRDQSEKVRRRILSTLLQVRPPVARSVQLRWFLSDRDQHHHVLKLHHRLLLRTMIYFSDRVFRTVFYLTFPNKIRTATKDKHTQQKLFRRPMFASLSMCRKKGDVLSFLLSFLPAWFNIRLSTSVISLRWSNHDARRNAHRHVAIVQFSSYIADEERKKTDERMSAYTHRTFIVS